MIKPSGSSSQETLRTKSRSVQGEHQAASEEETEAAQEEDRLTTNRVAITLRG